MSTCLFLYDGVYNHIYTYTFIICSCSIADQQQSSVNQTIEERLAEMGYEKDTIQTAIDLLTAQSGITLHVCSLWTHVYQVAFRKQCGCIRTDTFWDGFAFSSPSVKI